MGAGWEFTDDASSGEQALVNVDIDDGQSAGFEIDVDFPVETLVIFDAKVSSESCCDELNVRRNGVELLRIVAQEEYAEFQVAVPPGLGTLSFTYDKDGSVSTGLDSAWLDNLRFETAAFDEQCDDGEANADTPDACRVTCLLPACSDGILDTGEECDDGNFIADDGCSNNCLTPQCGDGVVQAGEECDDGNDLDSDGCLPDCTLAACGDGIVNVPTRTETFETPSSPGPSAKRASSTRTPSRAWMAVVTSRTTATSRSTTCASSSASSARWTPRTACRASSAASCPT